MLARGGNGEDGGEDGEERDGDGEDGLHSGGCVWWVLVERLKVEKSC